MRGFDTLSLVPVLAIAAASGWLAGCSGAARSTPAVAAPVAEPTQVTDLRPLWDTERVLSNPYKGWYHHYYDNGTRNYRLSSDDDLDQFPGRQLRAQHKPRVKNARRVLSSASPLLLTGITSPTSTR